MSPRRTNPILAALAALLLPTAALAHHSFAAHFLMDRFAEVEGRISRVEWINPHVKIYVEDAAGATWEVEAGPVNLLSRMGLERDMLEIGETIRARGNPGRRDEHMLWVASVLLADNTELLVGPGAEPYYTAEGVGDSSAFFEAGTLGTVRQRSFFRIWTPLVSSMPRPLEDPALSETGTAAQARYGIDKQVVSDCEVPGMPFAMMSPYPIELVERGDDILLRGEAYDLERVLHTQPPANEPEPSPLGYSLARMEGDDLIVETTGIDYHSYGDLGPAQSSESRVTERFSLSEDGQQLDYAITVEDPVMLTGAWRWGGRFIYRDGAEIKPWNCGLE